MSTVSIRKDMHFYDNDRIGRILARNRDLPIVFTRRGVNLADMLARSAHRYNYVNRGIVVVESNVEIRFGRVLVMSDGIVDRLFESVDQLRSFLRERYSGKYCQRCSDALIESMIKARSGDWKDAIIIEIND